MRGTILLRILLTLALLGLTTNAGAWTHCTLPDNCSGTVDFPPDCPDGYLGLMRMYDVLNLYRCSLCRGEWLQTKEGVKTCVAHPWF